jgi:hypothetical protein
MQRAMGLMIAGALALAAVPAAAQKVQIDYDREADFAKYSTFAWADVSDETSLKNVNPLMHSRLKNAIEDEFGKAGITQVESDPDFYITYHTSFTDEVRYDTSHFGYGYGHGWYRGGGMGSSTTTATTYTNGSLIIDLWDAETENLIWRGVITGTVKSNPEKNARMIDKGVEKLARKWAKMYGGNAR